MKAKVFLTGATGVIGRRVVPLLVAAGHQVTAVGRSAEKRAQLERQGARALAVDLFDAAAASAAVRGSDVVINLATHIPPSSRVWWPGAWRQNSRVRREVSANLAAAVRQTGAGRLIQESFAPIYADGGERWLDETAPVAAARYNRTVLDAETAAARVGGVVLRFAFFYGPDADFSQDAMGMVRRGWAPVFGSPEAYFSSIHHDDAATAVVAALELPAGVYNVTDDRPVPRREFAGAIAVALGVKPPRFLPRWLGKLAGSLGETLSRSQRIANGKLRSAGWAPRYPSVVEGWRAVIKDVAAGAQPKDG